MFIILRDKSHLHNVIYWILTTQNRQKKRFHNYFPVVEGTIAQWVYEMTSSEMDVV